MSRRLIGRLILAAALAALDAAAFRESWRMLTVPRPGPSSGPSNAHRSFEDYANGRVFVVITNHETGDVSRTQIRPSSLEGHVEVWWPVLAAATFSVLTIWFVRRAGARHLLRVIRPPRATIAGWMIVVAVMGGECGLLYAWMRWLKINPDTANWPAILLCVVGWNVLGLLPAGILLSYRGGSGRRAETKAGPPHPLA